MLCAQRSDLLLIDAERKLYYRAGQIDAKAEPLGEGLIGHVVATGKVLRLPESPSKKSKKEGRGADDM